MEADDTIAAADENAIFEEVDDAGEDVTDPFADLDDNCKKTIFLKLFSGNDIFIMNVISTATPLFLNQWLI